MQSKGSIALTSSPVVSFGGALATNSTDQWSRDPWIEYDVTSAVGVTLFANWIRPTGAIVGAHFAQNQPDWAQEVGHERLLRVFCHYLLESIPSQGLQETGETLAHLLKFYMERHEEPQFLPAHTVETGTLGKSYERGPLYISEE